MVNNWDELQKYIETNESAFDTRANTSIRSGSWITFKEYKILYANFNKWFSKTTKTAKQRFKNLLLAFPGTRELLVLYSYERTYKNPNSDNFAAMYQEVKNHQTEMQQVYRLLQDARSRKAYVWLIMARLARDPQYFLSAFDEETPQYFDPCMEFGCQEVIVDAGAYTGDTFLAYLQQVGTPLKYYLYEPEGDNLQQLRQTLAEADPTGVMAEIRPFAVHSEKATLSFEGRKKESSHISDSGQIKIQAVALDQEDLDNVTWIKMDIEGAEMNALRGAKDLIQRCKPKLAICIYHKNSDFWRVPLYIHTICPDYKNYVIRHYTPMGWDTVLYVY